MTQFKDLGLSETLLRALNDEGYVTPTPIQQQAIPPVLAGRDLMGIAQTGTGKTAAFSLPLLQRLAGGRPAPGRHCRALILAPTRELAAQIADSIKAYGRHQRATVAVIVGGVGYGPQVRAMSRGVDVLVATPGRLLDHMTQGTVRLDGTEIVVLDEADHMLDLGFLVPIRKILAKIPARRQSLFFSATMPKEIATLAGEMLNEPVQVAVTPVATTAERVEQSVYLIESGRKRYLLEELLADETMARTLVFTRTKRGADRVAASLEEAGIPAAAIHGNKSQGQREKALDGFRRGRTRVLVATDIAARGIDVDGVSHVVNFELPNVPESYVHRIGRTARAGAAGMAISFCDIEERGLLRDIERLTRQTLPLIDRRDPARARTEPVRPVKPLGKPGGHGRPQGQRSANAAGAPSGTAPRRRRRPQGGGMPRQAAG